jgi:predicted metalloprotease with PDZ domain
MSSHWKHLQWVAVLAVATAFAQTTPPPPQPSSPDAPQAQAPETPEVPPTPKVKVRPPKPPKVPRGRAYAYSFNDADSSASYLGVGVRDVTHETMGQLKLKDEMGVEVTSLDSEGPAAKAGLKEHDVILTFNGQAVEGFEQLRRMIRETPPGRKVKLGISRAGQPMNIDLTLAKREDWSMVVRPNVIQIPKVEIPPMNFEWDMPGFTVLQISSRSGATVEDLTPQLGDFFGTKGGEGVLVRNVERGSPADTAGLKAGDVIIKVGAEHVSNANDWRRLMRQQRTGAIPLTILRDRREQTLSMKLPERRSSDAAFQSVFPQPTAYQMAEAQKTLARIQAELARSSQNAARDVTRSLTQQQRELQREIERSMRELQRELQREQ